MGPSSPIFNANRHRDSVFKRIRIPQIWRVGACLGGMVIMSLERHADMWAYWNTTTYWVVPKDFLTGVGKAVFFGAVVTLIGCYNGLSTEGGTEGLGRATTATVVHVTMGVIVSDFFLTKLFLTLFY